MIDTQDIIRRKAEIEQQYGKWVAHNIKLAEGVYTMSPDGAANKTAPLHILQAVADVVGAPLNSLRVLDLACLEGAYAIEFALHGARVVGIEGRRINIAKAEFAKEVLGLANLELFEDDVRNLSEEKYGRFDVILCCGLLYHLDVPDVFEFMERVSSVCDRILFLDTHVSLRSEESVEYKGKTYHGWHYHEFSPAATDAQKALSNESSLDNNESFWFTRRSLWNLIKNVGFTSAYMCVNPAFPMGYNDRDAFIAVKGRLQTVISSPAINDSPIPEWPEQDERLPQPSQAAALQAAASVSPRLNIFRRTIRKIGKATRPRSN